MATPPLLGDLSDTRDLGDERVMRSLVDGVQKMSDKVELDLFIFWSAWLLPWRYPREIFCKPLLLPHRSRNWNCMWRCSGFHPVTRQVDRRFSIGESYTVAARV